MSDIKELKKDEMMEVIDFYSFIKDYGHIFYDDPVVLDKPFKKIMEGIKEVRNIVEDNYGK
jgi:hypothetical protein